MTKYNKRQAIEVQSFIEKTENLRKIFRPNKPKEQVSFWEIKILGGLQLLVTV